MLYDLLEQYGVRIQAVGKTRTLLRKVQALQDASYPWVYAVSQAVEETECALPDWCGTGSSLTAGVSA
jgi:hypothetical protein